MDGSRFDSWARHIGAVNSRRKALAVLTGAALAALGLGGADAKGRKHAGHGNDTSHGNNKKRENDQHKDDRHDTAHGKAADGRQNRHNADDPEAARKKKKRKCMREGGSCKQPKKGKAKKCCAGLVCDRTKHCTPSGGGERCASESKACQGGCIQQDTPCCPDGKRPCDGSCVSGTRACEAEFAHCMAPVVGDWFEAVDACADECASPESVACRECLDGVLEEFAEPLTRCFRVTCTDATQEGMAARSVARAAALRTCDRDKLRICRLDALISGTGQATNATLVGALDGPIGAVGGFLLSAGLSYADINACEQQFGCPGGECDPNHGVCCDAWNCQYYDPSTKACSSSCANDSQCDFVTRTCRKQCKECYDYLVDGRQMPCGQITNNCGKVLTCNGCAADERCVDRRCKPNACSRRGKQRDARAEGDDCCLPKTCAELGKDCGAWDDDCGEALICGECPDGKSCDSGTCQFTDPCADGQRCAVIGTVTQTQTRHVSEETVWYGQRLLTTVVEVTNAAWIVDETGQMFVEGTYILDRQEEKACCQCAECRDCAVERFSSSALWAAAFSGPYDGEFHSDEPFRATVDGGTTLTFTHHIDAGCGEDPIDFSREEPHRVAAVMPFSIGPMSEDYTWTDSSSGPYELQGQTYQLEQTWDLRWARLP